MSRAPFVMGKAEIAYQRQAELQDTTIGWRFINPIMRAQYGVDSMPETAENVAEEFQITRDDQDAFALRSQQRASRAQVDGTFAQEIMAVEIPDQKGTHIRIDTDEHPRSNTTAETLAKLKPFVRSDGTVTSGGGADRCFSPRGREARTEATGSHSRARLGRGPAAYHGDRPGAGRDQALRAAQS
jgi:3-oxoadipyl-CoA thiolase